MFIYFLRHPHHRSCARGPIFIHLARTGLMPTQAAPLSGWWDVKWWDGQLSGCTLPGKLIAVLRPQNQKSQKLIGVRHEVPLSPCRGPRNGWPLTKLSQFRKRLGPSSCSHVPIRKVMEHVQSQLFLVAHGMGSTIGP